MLSSGTSRANGRDVLASEPLVPCSIRLIPNWTPAYAGPVFRLTRLSPAQSLRLSIFRSGICRCLASAIRHEYYENTRELHPGFRDLVLKQKLKDMGPQYKVTSYNKSVRLVKATNLEPHLLGQAEKAPLGESRPSSLVQLTAAREKRIKTNRWSL